MVAKGYWIGNVTVCNQAKVLEYREPNRETLNRYGVEFIVYAGQQTILENPVFPIRTVVEFPSYAAAVACREDPAYKAAGKIWEDANAMECIGAIVEGYDRPQDF